MKFTIDNNDYEVKFNFKTCGKLRGMIKGLNTEDESEMVDVIFEKGSAMVRTALVANKQKPLPSIEVIEDYFDEDEGFAANFFVAALKGMQGHVTPTRAKEIEKAAKGN